MKVVIMGCGRVGARLAAQLDAAGHSVVIIDLNAYSFRRLSQTYKGKAIVGNGIDTEVLKKAGIESAEVFIALTQGDNRNIMASQIAKHIFNVPRAICRIYDPLRQELFATLGLETISPTTIFADLLQKRVEG
ncbi:MAG: TrkA family potassium uptake protein [Dehalococcoidales bacterium]|nr:TrkA family potassium uptake protein [Dehalococcoidales bacterium]